MLSLQTRAERKRLMTTGRRTAALRCAVCDSRERNKLGVINPTESRPDNAHLWDTPSPFPSLLPGWNFRLLLVTLLLFPSSFVSRGSTHINHEIATIRSSIGHPLSLPFRSTLYASPTS